MQVWWCCGWCLVVIGSGGGGFYPVGGVTTVGSIKCKPMERNRQMSRGRRGPEEVRRSWPCTHPPHSRPLQARGERSESSCSPRPCTKELDEAGPSPPPPTLVPCRPAVSARQYIDPLVTPGAEAKLPASSSMKAQMPRK